MKLTADNIYFINVDDDKGFIDERGILISCNHEDKNSLFGECKKCEKIKSQILENQNTIEKIKYRVTQFRIENGMIQDKFAYDALREILKESEKQ